VLSTIKAEIEKYMTGRTREGATATSRFAFPSGFAGFQGHFPEKKILPGVCQIQCALSTFEKGAERAVVLKEVVLAKYYSPVFPDDEMTCVVSGLGDSGKEFMVKAVITKESVKIADLKLRLSFADQNGNP
jgi:3-hydroxymyristoyl/3-hydroxydecanoyl-(acyl carrier protein) dehydratase